MIVCLDGGAWYDAEAGHWRSGRGRPLRRLPGLEVLASARLTVPILAAVTRAHDTKPERRPGSRRLVPALPPDPRPARASAAAAADLSAAASAGRPVSRDLPDQLEQRPITL